MRFFSFGYNGVLVLYLSFRAGIYGTKTGMVSRKMKLVIFTCLSAKLQRRFAAREYCSGASPPPAFLSEKSGAKELNFSCFTLSFRAGVYGTKMGMDLRKIYLPF